MMKVLFLVLLAVVAVNAQFPNDDDDQVTIVLVDDFTVGGNVQEVVVSLDDGDLEETDPPVIVDSFFNSPGCSGLVGCGRDMRMEAITGFAGRSFDSQIFLINGGDFDGEWAVANPKTSSSIATIQYDGQDSTFDLDVNGLDLDLEENVETLKLSIITDLPSIYTMTVYSPNGNTCSASIAAPVLTGTYDYTETFVEIPIDDFDGNCDMSNIGAIEIELPSNDAVDAIVRSIQFTGNVPVTQTPTPGPSPSNTPTPGPSPSNTPSATPTPSPSPLVCECECPLFQCGLIYAVPGDDDDNIDDDNNDDDDLIYVPVYYGPVDDDFDKIVGDDDEDEFISFQGGLTVNHADDDDETASSASMLSASLFVVVLAALLM